MSKQEPDYVRGAEGKFYLEVEGPDGTCEYIPADPEIQEFVALMDAHGMATGRYRAVRDRAEYARQREETSHKAFFGLDPDHMDPQKARQRMRSVDQLSQKFALAVSEERAAPGGGGYKFEIVKDEVATELMLAAQRAVQSGTPQSQLDFIPFSLYGHKLVTKGGRQLRQVFKGEVGTRPDGTIVCLEKGYGEGNTVQSAGVPEGAKVEQKDGYTVTDTRSSAEEAS
jgi:hypothetical protein